VDHFQQNPAPPLPPLPPLPAPPREKKWAPWTTESAPRLGVLLRPVVNRVMHRVPIGWEPDAVNLFAGRVSYASLLEKWECSIDGGETWSLCGVKVDA